MSDAAHPFLDPRDVVGWLSRRRLPLVGEKVLQAQIEAALEADGIPFEREVRLGPGEVIDFMLGGIGLEVKVGGAKRAIHRQCEGYARHERVAALVLATSVAVRFPARVGGKPALVASLGTAWL